MSIAAAQYAKFLEQAVSEGRVFTFTQSDEYLVFRVHDREVIPFWSSRSRMEKTQEEHTKYQKYLIAEMKLDEFTNWLPKLGEDRISIGVNWSGKKLTGYDIEAGSLLEGLRHQITKAGGSTQS